MPLIIRHALLILGVFGKQIILHTRTITFYPQFDSAERYLRYPLSLTQILDVSRKAREEEKAEAEEGGKAKVNQS